MSDNNNGGLYLRFLEILSNLTVTKMIILFMLALVGYLVFTSTESIKNYVDVFFEGKTHTMQQEVSIKLPLTAEKAIDNILNEFMLSDPNISMILIYQFLPPDSAFYQGRYLVASKINPSSSLDLDEMHLKWIPISSFRGQSNKILNGNIFSTPIKDIYTEKLRSDNPDRDEYLTAINFQGIYRSGMKYMVSIPINTYRIVGYISIYYYNPIDSSIDGDYSTNINNLEEFSNRIGYYLSY